MTKDNYQNRTYVFTSEFRGLPILKIGKSDEPLNRCDKWNKDTQKIENRDLKEFVNVLTYETPPGEAYSCETKMINEAKKHFKKVPGTSREVFYGTIKDFELKVTTPDFLETHKMEIIQVTPDIHKIVRMSDDGLHCLVKYVGYTSTTRTTIDKLNRNPNNRKKIEIYKKKSMVTNIIDRSEDGNDWTVELSNGEIVKHTIEKLNVIMENKEILKEYEDSQGIFEIEKILSYYRSGSDIEYLVLFVDGHYEWVSPTLDFKESIDTFHSENIIVDCRVNSTNSEYLVKNTRCQEETWFGKNFVRKIDIDAFHKQLP